MQLIHTASKTKRFHAPRVAGRPAGELRPAAPATEVERVFQSLGGEATRDVIALYGRSDGMVAMSAAGWRLWPLQELATRNAQRRHPGIAFSDYGGGASVFELHRCNSNVSAVKVDGRDGESPWVISSHLDSFLEALAEHDRQLEALMPAGPGAE